MGRIFVELVLPVAISVIVLVFLITPMSNQILAQQGRYYRFTPDNYLEVATKLASDIRANGHDKKNKSGRNGVRALVDIELGWDHLQYTLVPNEHLRSLPGLWIFAQQKVMKGVFHSC